MREYQETPKNHIVSCRLSNDEMILLRRLARRKGVNVTTIIRQGLAALQLDISNSA